KSGEWRHYQNIFCVHRHVDGCQDESYLPRAHYVIDGDSRVTMLWRLLDSGPWRYAVPVTCGNSTRCELMLLCRGLLEGCSCGGVDGYAATDFRIAVSLKVDPPNLADDPLFWPELIHDIKLPLTIPAAEVTVATPERVQIEEAPRPLLPPGNAGL